MNRLLWLVFFISLFAFSLKASISSIETFQQANAAYTDKDFQTAIQLYQQLLSANYNSPELEYNLGNAYFQLDSIGAAILHYERALRLDSNHPSIQHNLALANERKIDQFETLPPFFLKQWWLNVQNLWSASTWAALVLLLIWLSVAGFIVYLLNAQRTNRIRGFMVGSILLPISLLFLLFAYSKSNQEQASRKAIILTTTALKVAADDVSPIVVELHEGTKIELQDQINGWHKVRLQNGEEGWLPDAVFEKI